MGPLRRPINQVIGRPAHGADAQAALAALELRGVFGLIIRHSASVLGIKKPPISGWLNMSNNKKVRAFQFYLECIGNSLDIPSHLQM